MSVSPVTGITDSTTTTNSTNSTTAANSTDGMDESTFLKLFTTQLQYQDPLNPMDSSAFTAQLAQFSSLEQLYNVNTNIKNLVSSQNTLLAGMSVNLIGKTVTLQDGSSGQVTGISFDGTNTSVVINNQNTVLFNQVTNISG